MGRPEPSCSFSYTLPRQRTNRMKHYPFIDGLRAVAVLPVILFHFNIANVTGGYVGVDIFFVISGFLITGLIASQISEKQFSIIHFYERRARRILPALFVMCLLSTIGALALLMPNHFIQFSRSLLGVAGFVSNFVFVRWTGYFTDTGSTNPLLHTWSIAIEEQFYVLFPLLLYALHRFFKDGAYAVRSAIYILFAISFALNLAFLTDSPKHAFYLLDTRAWELLAGSILALHLKDIPLSRYTAEALSGAGILILLLCFFMYDRNTPFPGLAALPPCLATMFLLWSNTRHETVTGKILSNKLCVGIGLISYGLYLYHWPIVVFMRYYLRHEPNTLLLLPVIFILSTLSYFYIEKPVRTGVRLRKNSIFWFSTAGLASLALVGMLGLDTRGFSSRFDSTVLQLAAAATDENPLKCATYYRRHVMTDAVCKIGDLQKPLPEFFLWGDSHAYVMTPAFEALALKHKMSGLAHSASICPPLIGTEQADHTVNPSCKKTTDAALEIMRRDRIKNVIIVSRWDVYALGWEKNGIETERDPFMAFTTADGQQLVGKEAFAAAFAETVRKLTEMGVNVWIVKQVPPQVIDPPSALALAQYLARNPKNLERSYGEILKRRSFIDAVFSETAARYPLNFIDPAEQFCPQRKTCLLTSENHSLYSDSSHLSHYGALWSQNMLQPFFKSLLPQK